MFFFKRISKTLIGFVTCSTVIVVLMLLLWSTLGIDELTQLNIDMTDDYGAGGHFWVILLILLNISVFIKMPIPIAGVPNDVENMGNAGVLILILVIWLIGSFAGGLASRGGLKSGIWSAILSYLFLDFLFATMSASMAVSTTGGFLIFIVNFFAPMALGSFFIIPVIGLAGGIAGGILGKMLFTKPKKKDEDKDEAKVDIKDDIKDEEESKE